MDLMTQRRAEQEEMSVDELLARAAYLNRYWATPAYADDCNSYTGQAEANDCLAVASKKATKQGIELYPQYTPAPSALWGRVILRE